jgi:hypothetical protein
MPFENFYGILEYGEDDVKNWLVGYLIKNQDIQEELHNLSIDLRDLESKFFNIKIWHEISMAPMRSYIEEWFKKDVDQVTNEGKMTLHIVPITTEESHKRTSTSK